MTNTSACAREAENGILTTDRTDSLEWGKIVVPKNPWILAKAPAPLTGRNNRLPDKRGAGGRDMGRLARPRKNFTTTRHRLKMTSSSERNSEGTSQKKTDAAQIEKGKKKTKKKNDRTRGTSKNNPEGEAQANTGDTWR